MAERKVVNKYYPPEWDPSKGSLNKWQHQHPLRERAKRLSEGILIIRFEMPYNIWCGGCGIHIAQGVRYNAQKKCVGKYFSTKIWSFRFRCHLCPNWIEIRTDPQHARYVVHEGARQKVETYDPVKVGVMNYASEEEKKKLATDPFYALEHAAKDKQVAVDAAPDLNRLIEMNEAKSDDFAVSQMLRKRLRDSKAIDKRARQRMGLSADTPLLPASDEDARLAQQAHFLPGSGARPLPSKRALIRQHLAMTVGPLLPASSYSPAALAQRNDAARAFMIARRLGIKTSHFARPASVGGLGTPDAPVVPTSMVTVSRTSAPAPAAAPSVPKIAFEKAVTPWRPDPSDAALSPPVAGALSSPPAPERVEMHGQQDMEEEGADLPPEDPTSHFLPDDDDGDGVGRGDGNGGDPPETADKTQEVVPLGSPPVVRGEISKSDAESSKSTPAPSPQSLSRRKHDGFSPQTLSPSSTAAELPLPRRPGT